jgi:hypothetical protein
MGIDPNLVVGFTRQRPYGFRVLKRTRDNFAMGFSVGGSQTAAGGPGFGRCTDTAATDGTTIYQNFFAEAYGRMTMHIT